jgi:transcriptional regulator of acetoin/glycerol metabolism
MLDLTGVEVPERPELKHLVTLSAQRIENALLHQQTFSLRVHLRWPSDDPMGGQNARLDNHFTVGESDGMLCLDNDGYVTGSNTTARHMLPTLLNASQDRVHCSDLFAMPWENLFDAALLGGAALEVPLWSGLRLQALALLPQDISRPVTASMVPRSTTASLRDVETTLIHKAVDQARGNVAQAARALGISRATVYRKLGAAAAAKT